MRKAKFSERMRGSKVSKERMRNLIINYEMKKGTSSNTILRKLRAKGLGIKRKDFLAKIRVKKGITKRFDTSKNIPKKHRKKKTIYVPSFLTPQEKPKGNFMYRVSMAINDVPIHKKYVSFLLQAFSLNKEELTKKIDNLKIKLLDLTNSYLGYNYNALAEWQGFHYYIAVEYPTEILLNQQVLEMWFFKVERSGSVTYDKSGSLYTV